MLATILITGLALIATGLFLAYQAGNDAIRDAYVTDQYADALVEASRQRHPSSQGPA
jgi:hypothetical protein